MSIYWQAVLLSCGIGAGGTAIGAASALAIRRPHRNLSCTLLGIAGGLVLALVVLDMIPEAAEMGGPWPFWTGFAAGIAVMCYIAVRSHGKHVHEADAAEASEIQKRSLFRTGILLAAGMAVHNLPQGIAIGSALGSTYIAGLAILLFLHNIPEGMAMAIPLRIGGVRAGKIIYVAMLTALPTIAGAVVGAAISGISPALIGAAMAFAAGAMLFLTLRELLPQAAALGGFLYVLISTAAGFGIGGLIIWILD